MVHNSALLNVVNLAVIRGNKCLLDNLNLRFESGEFVALAGENGCGKSSLLTLLSGIESVRSGKIWFKGVEFPTQDTRYLAQYRSVMTQHTYTPFGFMVDEILQLARHQIIESVERRNECVAEVARQCDIAHLLNRNVQTLSGGERQRVFLAKAILQLLPTSENESLAGKLLLLDEPTSALDYRHQKLVMQQLVKLSNRGLCVICISHDLNLITPYCTRLILLGQQCCLADDVPENALTSHTLALCFHTRLNLIRNSGVGVFVTH